MTEMRARVGEAGLQAARRLVFAEMVRDRNK